MPSSRFNRRQALLAAISLGAGLAVQHRLLAAGAATAPGTPLLKAIPSSGQKIPAIGVGTNNFDVAAADDIAARRSVLAQLPVLGGSVVT